MTDAERRALGNKIKTADPAEYLRLVKEKGERSHAKWLRSKERVKRLMGRKT